MNDYWHWKPLQVHKQRDGQKQVLYVSSGLQVCFWENYRNSFAFFQEIFMPAQEHWLFCSQARCCKKWLHWLPEAEMKKKKQGGKKKKGDKEGEITCYAVDDLNNLKLIPKLLIMFEQSCVPLGWSCYLWLRKWRANKHPEITCSCTSEVCFPQKARLFQKPCSCHSASRKEWPLSSKPKLLSCHFWCVLLWFRATVAL